MDDTERTLDDNLVDAHQLRFLIGASIAAVASAAVAIWTIAVPLTDFLSEIAHAIIH